MDNSNTNRIFAIVYYEKYSEIMDKELTIKDIMEIAAKDESRVLELKQSTGELYKAMTSACAFLNTDGDGCSLASLPNYKLLDRMSPTQQGRKLRLL